MSGVLYLVSIPIGNYEDITFRALRILKETDVIVCEERNEGVRFLRHYGIEKQIETLNEHNESAASTIILGWLKENKSVALISDAGTPVFSDPGLILVDKVIKQGIKIVPIPGASSLLPALIVSGFPIKEFVFAGFLSPKKERRILELRQFKKEQRTIIFMDTPYRLAQLLRDMADVFGETRRICVAFDLTMPSEEIYRGTPPQLYKLIAKEEKKGEFVVVLEGK
jgi:16S rRNA (cytidine1402-2'-O)-methyltransferase